MRQRIIVSIVGVATVAVLLLGAPLAVAVSRLYANQEVLRLERVASDARNAVDPASLGRGDPVELPAAGSTTIGAYDRTGRLVGGVGPPQGDGPVRLALRGSVQDAHPAGRIVVAVPINGPEAVVGVLRASRSSSVVAGRTHRAWLIMTLIAAGALLVAALLAGWQARRLTRPVDALVASAEQLGSGDFATRTGRSGVTELDHLGLALDNTAERLGGLVARERAFSSDASHQLRTPIAGLRVHVESALLDPNADVRAALAGTLEPIDRLEATVDDLLRLARDTHVDRSPLDLDRVICDVERGWHGPLDAQGRPLRVVVDGGLPAPAVSEPAVRQILDVLVANAERHGAGTVTLSARQLPGAVSISVTDEGDGVADARAVFQRRTNGGHGIGLALARTLAEAEGGRLVLERPGPRPRFALLLPVPEP
jgi:signal transduction histidine kinase